MNRRGEPGDVAKYVGRLVDLGYTVSQRSTSFMRPDSGERVPAVFVIESRGVSFRLRDDELDAWDSFVESHDHDKRLHPEGLGPLPSGRRAPRGVIGPIRVEKDQQDGRGYPQFASHIDLSSFGYLEEEYFFEGEAASVAVRELEDGLVLSDGHRYRARLISRRPSDPGRCNGTVIVEWLNVTTFANVDQLWWEGSVPRMLMDRGFAYVGVSVQRHGIHAPDTGLREWSPARYGSLDLTDGSQVLDDSLAFDIFSQAGELTRDPANGVLGGTKPTTVLGYGSSQSQRLLRSYINSVHPRTGTYDGFLLTLGDGLIRDEVDDPVFRVNTETDVLRGSVYSRQHDSSKTRTWEVAGASHLSYQMAQVRAVLCERDGLPPLPQAVAEKPPLSRIPWGHALSAAIGHLDRWVRGDEPPPCAPLIALDSVADGRPLSTRDIFGNAVGGLRLSQHAVPTATNQGLNSGPGLAPLWGVHIPFDSSTLMALYPTRASYVDAVRNQDEVNVRSGYLLEADARANLAEAEELGVQV